MSTHRLTLSQSSRDPEAPRTRCARKRTCIHKSWPQCLSAEAHGGGFLPVGKLTNPGLIIRDWQEFGPIHALTFRRSDSRITPQRMKSMM